MVKELKQQNKEINIRFVDFSRDSQREGSGTPARDMTDFPVIHSKWYIDDDKYPEEWGKRFKAVPAWRNIAIILDAEARVTGCFDFRTFDPSKLLPLREPANYKALKNLVLKAYKSEDKKPDETETKEEVPAPTREEEIEAKFKKLDLDNNGQLSSTELTGRRITKGLEHLMALFRAFDTNRDNVVDLEEYKEKMLLAKKPAGDEPKSKKVGDIAPEAKD